MGIGYKGGIAREALDFQNIADGNLDMADYHIYMGAGAIGNDDEILTFASGATGLASFAGGVTLTTGNLTLTAGNLLIGANGIGNNASILTFAVSGTGLATLGGALTIAGDLTMGSNDVIMGTGLIGYDGTASKGLSFDSGNEKVTLESGQLLLPDGTKTLPSAASVSNPDTGIYFDGNVIRVTIDDNNYYQFSSTGMGATVAGGAFLARVAGSATVAVFRFNGDTNTGMGLAAADAPCIVAGGVEAMRWTEATTIVTTAYGLFDFGTTAGITASTTQSQGQQPLTSSVNEISTWANGNDVVTLPTAVAGRQCIIIHNGAQTLQIFPASGDNLGSGVNSSTTLAAASNVRFVTYDDTNWEQV